MALERILSQKPTTCNEITLITKVDFSENSIDLSILRNHNLLSPFSGYRSYRMWSIELGMIDFVLKENQTLYYGIVRRLKKLQKEDVPSHLIVSKYKVEGKVRTTTHTIYRLTEEQETEMYFEGLTPSINKRANALHERAVKEHEAYLTYINEF
jgi:hypothetical protein